MASSTAHHSKKSKKTLQKGSNGSCVFCKRAINDDDDLKFGQREFSGKFTVHYFCMLLSTQLLQQGEDDEGIKGFLDVDIYKELRRARKDRCCYCSEKGATVKCARSSCRRIFHFPCGFEVGAVPDFNSESFNVFCAEHARRRQTISPLLKEDGTAECLVCLESLKIDLTRPLPRDLLVSPCCRQLYEKGCLRGYARVAGLHHFKCSQCRNEEDFLYSCRENGIFVPDQDAEWERNDEFADHYIPHSTCDVPVCLCPEGRSNIEDHDDWEVVRCDDCGKSGTHIKCSNLTQGAMSPYKCNDCESIGPHCTPANPISATQYSGQEGSNDVVPHSSSHCMTSNSSNVRWYQESKLHKASTGEAIIVLKKESIEDAGKVIDVDDSCTAIAHDNKENQQTDKGSSAICTPESPDTRQPNKNDRDLLYLDVCTSSVETPPLLCSDSESSTPSRSPSSAFRQLTLGIHASPTKLSPSLDAVRDKRHLTTDAAGNFSTPSTSRSPCKSTGRLLAPAYPRNEASPPKKRPRRCKLQKGQTTLDNFFKSPGKKSDLPVKSEPCSKSGENKKNEKLLPILGWLCRGLTFATPSNSIEQDGPCMSRREIVRIEPVYGDK